MISNAYVHSLDPFAIQFTESFGIRWYGLSYLTGFFLAYLTMRYMSRKGTIQPNEQQVSDFITYLAIGTLVGGRIGYVLFYSPDLLTQWTSSFPFWGALAVQNGGMASHGGIIGIILACVFFARKHGFIKRHLIDLTVFGGGLGVFFGRIANFINGELYGRIVTEPISWAVKFPQEIYRWGYQDTERLKSLAKAVEALPQMAVRGGEKIDATAQMWLEWVNKFDIQSQYMIDFYKEKLVLATQQGNAEVIQALGEALVSRYPSQLIQALLEGLLVVIVLAIIWLKPQKPGVISASWGVLYAIARIIGEQYRMPDAHIGFELFGLTRGQWLSIAMLMGMIVYLAVSIRDPKTEKVGGWGLKTSEKS